MGSLVSAVNRAVEFAALYKHLYLTTQLRRKAQAFHQRHSGRCAVIIGNGPSVDIDLLPKLNDAVTFACNRFHLCYPQTTFRPDYTVIVDNQMMADFGDDIHRQADSPVFSGDLALAQSHEQGYYVPLSCLKAFSFADLKQRGYLHPGDCVVVAAIQLAYLMGIRNIFLYGVDHSFAFQHSSELTDGRVTGESNHFIDNYRDGRPWYPPNTAVIEDAFSQCSKYIQRHGGQLVNLTPNTQLDQVPKGDVQHFISSGYESF
ncbi:MAG: hypothetical protein ACI8WB_002455 [Phenylobacterium sp.]|jgi:hypothetical protein